MRRLFALVGVLVASLAAASAATAAPYVTATGAHQYIYVTGFNFPTNGVPVTVSAYLGPGRAGLQVVTPNTHALPSPPCRVACGAGQFFAKITLRIDPCAGHPHNFSVVTNLYPGVAAVPVLVSCPAPPPPPPYKGCPPGAQGRDSTGKCVCEKNHEDLCS
jgi:hypothetical protein